MRTAQQIATEITDAIEEFEQHHTAANTELNNRQIDTGNLVTVHDAQKKHLNEFLGDMSFVKTDGTKFNRKDIEQHIIAILTTKTQSEVDTFLQQLHNDVNSARTLNNHIGQ